MFLFKKPSEEIILKFLSSQKNQTFSYRAVGSSKKGRFSGYNQDHYRIKLGVGKPCFERAVEAIRAWKMFEVGWVQLWMPNTPIEVGETVAAMIHHLDSGR